MHRYKTGKEGEWKGGFESEEDDIRREGRKGESEGGMEEGKDRGREGGRDERRKRGREGEREFKRKGREGSGKVIYKEWGTDEGCTDVQCIYRSLQTHTVSIRNTHYIYLSV